MINLSGVKIWSKAEVKAVADIKAKGEKNFKGDCMHYSWEKQWLRFLKILLAAERPNYTTTNWAYSTVVLNEDLQTRTYQRLTTAKHKVTRREQSYQTRHFATDA